MSEQAIRQVILDTETTGLSTADGHRIIEIGCVEMIGRRLTGATYHQYINPEREIDAGAQEVHGISIEDLADKPLFKDVADDFLAFIQGAELIIHNAPFDIGFLNYELAKAKYGGKNVEGTAGGIIDSLKMARDKHPGQKNNLDALCRRYDVNNNNRTLHGALLDSQILADVYLAMTGGQITLSLQAENTTEKRDEAQVMTAQSGERAPLKVIKATKEECSVHNEMLDLLDSKSEGTSVWRKPLPSAE